jgi:hypothetical protein
VEDKIVRVVVGAWWCSDFDVVVGEEEGERWVPRDDDNSKVVAVAVAVAVGDKKWWFFF